MLTRRWTEVTGDWKRVWDCFDPVGVGKIAKVGVGDSMTHALISFDLQQQASA